MNFINSRLPDNLLDNFDLDLQLFYNKVLHKELNVHDAVNDLKIKKALKEVVHAYKKDTVESLSSNILFDSLEKRYSYVLKHCPCFTSAVARHFLRLLQSNPHILHAAIHNRRQINICCLGGGPATDAVAVTKVVDALNNCIMYRYRSKLNIRVSLVDLSEDWATTGFKVINTLQETPEICDTEQVEVSFEFLQADLTEELTVHVRNVISEADILTMVYFVSAVNGSKVKNKCRPMLQNIMHALKPGAVLFFLDSSKDIHFKSVITAAYSFDNLKQIYGPRLQEFHSLSMKSVKTFINLYLERFNISMCLTNCFVSCAAWTKEQATLRVSLSINGALKNNFCNGKLRIPTNTFVNKGRNSLRKKIAYNTKKQEYFRQKIEKLLIRQLHMDFDVEDLSEDCENNSETEDWFCEEKILYPTKFKPKRIFV